MVIQTVRKQDMVPSEKNEHFYLADDLDDIGS